MTNKDEDALKFLADEGQKCDRVDALRARHDALCEAIQACEYVRLQFAHGDNPEKAAFEYERAVLALIAEGE